MTILRLPGLIDAHVHLREPGYEYKEDFASGTTAALAGGVTTVLDMPNTIPSTATPQTFAEKAQRAADHAVCDVGIFVGATTTHLDAYLPVAQQACGLKIYVSDTFGNLRIDTLDLLHRFFRTWAEKADQVGWRSERQAASTDAPPLGTIGKAQPRTPGIGPIAVHAEELMLPVCLNLSSLYDVPLHVVHVSRRCEIELIARAKEKGLQVTCEATPHHLFLSTDNLPELGALGDMRPRLATPDDVAALWQHLPVIDLFATDHAPHTLAEKRSEKPPPGVPGVETMLPLLLTAVHEGRLSVPDIVLRCVENPRRIYGLPVQEDTWVEVDVDARYVLTHEQMVTRVRWTPFAGKEVWGRVLRVMLRGKLVYQHGVNHAQIGSGRVLFSNA